MFFLDDMPERHESFESQLEAARIIPHWSAETGEHAIEQLREFPRFDVAFLDHDLGQEHYAEHRAGVREPTRVLDGTGVAEYIATMPEVQRPLVAIIHSWNRYGANRMARILYRAGLHVLQVPFCDDLVSQALAWRARVGA